MAKHGGVFEAIASRVERRTGKIPFAGRYHREPRKLEDDYVLSEIVLGSGKDGDVRLATTISQPEQKVAVKSFRLCSITDNHVQFDHEDCPLLREVENYLSIDHPHIVRLFDVYETKQDLHLVMECMQGGELFDRLKEKGRFSENEARNALRQMLLSLNYLHSHGVIHRDVKLDNVVYDAKGSDHLKLIDFGRSKVCFPGEEIRGMAGTPEYMAPEVLDGSAYSSKCDLWGLGVVGFALIQGHLPFCRLPGEGPSEVLEQICGGQYTLRPDEWGAVSTEAKNFIQALLEVNPDKRLSAQQALEHPWMLKFGRKCEGMKEILRALQNFRHLSKFNQCCRRMLAWSLSSEDLVKVRDYFTSLNMNHQGTISLDELKDAMADKLEFLEKQEVLQIFEALCYSHHGAFHYSDFLAAMLDTQIKIRYDLLTSALHRFGGLANSADVLYRALGNQGDDVNIDTLSEEVGHDGKMSFASFAATLIDSTEGSKRVQGTEYMEKWRNASTEKFPFASMEASPAYMTGLSKLLDPIGELQRIACPLDKKRKLMSCRAEYNAKRNCIFHSLPKSGKLLPQ